MSDDAIPWPRRLIAGWAEHRADEMRKWAIKVRRSYKIGTPLGDACGPYVVALDECANVLDRCAHQLRTP